ncbi:MAG: diguanylate cyclase [Treponema sp.]|nr:diguanylate cyclase [Treponema sp.]MBQ2234160.1 diguanylate cyclase [Treponema sp.]MBQ5632347.1 diguanylate cyclase [Treponema sp.]MBQ5876974.1 diguanylate cyclase [Treponema sp.]
MKSIRNKISLVILLCVLLSTWLVGFVSIVKLKKSISKDSVQIMNLLCSENAEKINSLFSRIERSVEILADYSVFNLKSVEKLESDKNYRAEYIKNIDSVGLTIAERTKGAVAVYVRFAPELTSTKSGFFRVKNYDTEKFDIEELTDLELYTSDNVGRVGWYYIPVMNKVATWLEPYYNFNINVNMISYVIPIYKGQTLLGVVGMDIDFDYLMSEIDRISVYETGHALITDNNLNVIHSVHYPKGPLIDDFYNADSNFKIENLFSEETLYEYEFEGKKRKIAVKPLSNDMCLAVTVLDSEINGSLNSLIAIIMWATIFISVFAIGVSFFLAYGITKPLSDLTRAAKEVSNGNLDVPITCNSQDEVGILSKIMQETVDKLKIRIEKMNVLAYTDNLTGVNNNTAYIHDMQKLVEQDKKFAIFIIDVNGLKIVNDTCGHDKGNELIITVARCISEIFGEEFVYRIGGDEFVAIKTNVNDDKCVYLRELLKQKFLKNKKIVKYSAAVGYSIYRTNKDFEQVFKEADSKMYQDKKNMKM